MANAVPSVPISGRSVSLSNAAAESDDLRKTVGGQVPTIKLAIFTVDENGFCDWVHSNRIDAPLANCAREIWEVRVRCDSLDGEHFVHHQRGREDGIGLGGVGVENCNFINAIAGADIGVVVVLSHHQIFRSSMIRRDQGCVDNRCRVIPTKTAGSFQLAESAVEVEQPAAVVVSGKRILEDTKIHVAIRANRRCGAAFVGDFGVESSVGVNQTDFGNGLQGLAVKSEQISKTKIDIVHTDVEGFSVVR